LLGNMPALDNTCTCMCTWGGVITRGVSGAGHRNDPVMSPHLTSVIPIVQKAGQ
jgi:hypothetical protein